MVGVGVGVGEVKKKRGEREMGKEIEGFLEIEEEREKGERRLILYFLSFF